MHHRSFADREDAGQRLAERLHGLPLVRPVVLAIPRGGIEIGAPIARKLSAELDVVLARKLRAQNQTELAIGAVSENGDVVLDPRAAVLAPTDAVYLDSERRHQVAEIERRKRLFRAVRPRAELAGRSAIVVDDGIATGSSMIAALRTVRAAGPREIIVAVPVAPPESLARIDELCDQIVCLIVTDELWAIGQFYRNFEQVEDARVVDLLRSVSDSAERFNQ